MYTMIAWTKTPGGRERWWGLVARATRRRELPSPTSQFSFLVQTQPLSQHKRFPQNNIVTVRIRRQGN